MKINKKKSDLKIMFQLSISYFHSDLSGKSLQAYVAKRFLFPTIDHVFHIDQKLQNYKL